MAALQLPSAIQPATSAPARTSSTGTPQKANDQQEHDRANGGVDDLCDHPRAEVDVQLGQEPTADKSAEYSYDEVSEDSESGTSNDLTCQPSRHDADKDDDKQAVA